MAALWCRKTKWCLCIAVVFTSLTFVVLRQAKVDPNRGLRAFFLKDPRDAMCLGPDGFGVCDTTSLWVFADRQKKQSYSIVSLLESDPNLMCLVKKKKWGQSSPVTAGRCTHSGARHWSIEHASDKDSFVLKEGRKNCVVRAHGKKAYRHTASTIPCKLGYTKLELDIQHVHDEGFYLQGADEKCFNGTIFKACNPYDRTLLWGIGFKFARNGDAERYFYRFHSPVSRGGLYGSSSGGSGSTARDKAVLESGECLIRKGRQIDVGPCSSKMALRWGIENGILSQEPRGWFFFPAKPWCMVRTMDNHAKMDRCNAGSEYILPVMPSTVAADTAAASASASAVSASAGRGTSYGQEASYGKYGY